MSTFVAKQKVFPGLAAKHNDKQEAKLSQMRWVETFLSHMGRFAVAHEKACCGEPEGKRRVWRISSRFCRTYESVTGDKST